MVLIISFHIVIFGLVLLTSLHTKTKNHIVIGSSHTLVCRWCSTYLIAYHHIWCFMTKFTLWWGVASLVLNSFYTTIFHYMLGCKNSKLNGWIELNVMRDVTKEKEHVLKSNSLVLICHYMINAMFWKHRVCCRHNLTNQFYN